MMIRSLVLFGLLVTSSSEASNESNRLRRLRPLLKHHDEDTSPRQTKQHWHSVAATTWQRRPVVDNDDGNGRRRLLNGGRMFIVSSQTTNDGTTEWCMDAVEGTQLDYNGQYPAVGLRPCAFEAGPTEQLFLPINDGAGIASHFYPGDFCLLVENATPSSGNVVRLGPCGGGGGQGGVAADSSWNYDEIAINGLADQIALVSYPNLCITFQGQTPEDDDRLIVATCQDNTDKFQWSFRSGWYYLWSGEGCVQVRYQSMTVGNRIVSDDCDNAGFAGHWRMDRHGLFHSRRDDKFCMRVAAQDESAAAEAGDAIRLALCDPQDNNQRWEWPDGFEAPINLVGTSFYLVTQGQTQTNGDYMVLGTFGYEFSGDAVHL